LGEVWDCFYWALGGAKGNITLLEGFQASPSSRSGVSGVEVEKTE